jgi:hydroxyacylglutathione hydrolase
MQINTLILGPFQVNCYILCCEQSNEAVIIDPGFDASEIIQKIGTKTVPYIFLTHAHIDHVGAVAEVKKYYQAKIVMDERELPLLRNVNVQATMFGMPVPLSFAVDHYAVDGETYSFGSCTVTALATPGHSPGGMSYLAGESVFVGDALFYNAVGRTDLPGSSHDLLIKSIREKLFTLPAEIRVYPGHGPDTTIDREKQCNPFF